MSTVNQMLTIGEASEYLGVSIDTLRRWTKKGKLSELRSPGGHRYFKKEDLDNLFGRKYERAKELKPRKQYETKNQSTVNRLQTTDKGLQDTDNSQQPTVNGLQTEDKIQVQTQEDTDKSINEETILQRNEVTKIRIPHLDPIRVIKEIPIPQPDTTYETDMSVSIPRLGFFPSITPSSISNIPFPSQPISTPQSSSILTHADNANQQKRVNSQKNNIFLIFIIILGLLLIIGALIYLFLTPPQILSPIG